MLDMGFTATVGRASARPGQISFDGAEGVMGNQGNLMFTVAAGGLTLRGIDEAYALHRRMRDAYPAGYAHFMLTRLNAPMPDAEARKRLTALSAEFGRHMLATAIAIEGEGVWASSVRMVLRTMSLAFRQAHPTQYFAEPESALAWLETQLGKECHFRKELVLSQIAELRTAPAVASAR